MLNLYDEFRDFHVFKRFKYLLGDWWNMDILIVVRKGSKFFYDNIDELNNPIVKDLLKSQLFRSYFLNTVNSVIDKNTNFQGKLKTLSWKQTGLNLFIVPLFIQDKPLSAVLVATGFAPKNQSLLEQALSYLDFSEKSIEQKIESLKQISSFDKGYIQKMLEILVEEFFKLLQERKQQNEMIKLLNRRDSSKQHESIIGASSAMSYIFNIMEKIKNHDTNILIEGELGTGKKLLAKEIHEQSLRSKKMFYSQNCSSFKGKLLEFEVFGEGFSSKTTRKKKTLLEKLEGGTLCLIDIGYSDLEFQEKLLRFLKSSTFSSNDPLKSRKANVRVIALTTQDLRMMTEQGKFNKNLYKELSLVHIKSPPLRKRKKDIPLLISHFFKMKSPMKKREFSLEALKILYQYSWPGNIKELESEIDRVLSLGSELKRVFTKKDLSPHIQFSGDQDHEFIKKFYNKPYSLKSALRSVEKTILLNCLRQHNWNKTKVAKALGTSRTFVVLKTKEYGLIKAREA